MKKPSPKTREIMRLRTDRDELMIVLSRILREARYGGQSDFTQAMVCELRTVGKALNEAQMILRKISGRGES
jgi:hypothetical protein